MNGFNNTPLEAILRRSAVKKGSFYFYFKSKEELGFAVMRHHLEEFRRECLVRILESGRPPLDRLEEILDALVGEQTRNGCRGGCPFGNMALELSDTHEGFRAELREIFDTITGLFRELLAEGADGLRRGLDLEGLSRFIVAGVEGGIMLSKLQRDVSPLRQCVAHLKTYLRQLRQGAVGEAAAQ